MNPNKIIWTGNQDELELLALEISEVKNILRELSQQVLRIDRRVSAVLPRPEKPISPDYRRQQCLNKSTARSTIDKLSERAKDGEQIENVLRRMKVKDGLAVLAKELGMTNTKLPPKDDLIRRISTRIRQRASVASGIREGVAGT